MNTTMLARFRSAFATHDWTPRQRRIYARQWADHVRLLGKRWRAVP